MIRLIGRIRQIRPILSRPHTHKEAHVRILTATLLIALAAQAAPPAKPKRAPVAYDASYSTPQRNLVVGLKARGGTPPLKCELLTQPAHGRAEIKRSSGRVKYTPARDFVGTDTFTFRFVDKNGQASAPATVTMDVTPRGDCRYTSGVSFRPPPHLEKIGATAKRLFKLGLLDVTLYDGWEGNAVDPTGRKDSTVGLQKALDDAYDYQLAVFLPAGTYLVSDTLHAVKKRSRFATWHTTAIVGSRKGARPMLRLAPNAPGFNDPKKPKPILWMWTNREGYNRGFGAPAREFNPSNQAAAMGFVQSIANVAFDCNGTRGNAGAIGLRFAGAQASHIHDVNVIATGAFAGIYDIPSRSSAGAANVEVVGGRYGLYLESGASSAIVGARLRDQTEAAVYTTQFPPIAMVGFHISKTEGPVITVQPSSWSTAANTISLMDGVIELAKGGPAFANPEAKNFYIRNVYVKGTDELVKTQDELVGGRGEWKRIAEYAHVDGRTFPDDPPYEYGDCKFASHAVVDGAVAKKSIVRIESNAPAPPEDLVSRHLWTKLPSFEDPDCVVLTEVSGADGSDDADDWAAFQKAVGKHDKVFMPKGQFRLGRTLTLRAKTQLFAINAAMTRIASHPDWKPTKEVTIVETVDDAQATTFLGNVMLGFQCLQKEHDWWNLLHWRAGRRSMTLGVTERYGAEGSYERNQKSRDANPHSLFKISGNGGGRWYFWGVDWSGPNQHPGYRHLFIDGTREPLWFYGCNLEKGLGITRAEIRNAKNVRIFSVKIETSRPIFKIHDSANIGIFSSGAMRNHCRGYKDHGESAYYWITGNSDGILLANINPQKNGPGEGGLTLLEDRGQGRLEIPYPEMIAVYKRGELDDGAMW